VSGIAGLFVVAGLVAGVTYWSTAIEDSGYERYA
jgi:hypothetical protein